MKKKKKKDSFARAPVHGGGRSVDPSGEQQACLRVVLGLGAGTHRVVTLGVTQRGGSGAGAERVNMMDEDQHVKNL